MLPKTPESTVSRAGDGPVHPRNAENWPRSRSTPYSANVGGQMNAVRRSAMAALLALAVFAFSAQAHHTGHESRTVADCEKLPGTATAGERGAVCAACSARGSI